MIELDLARQQLLAACPVVEPVEVHSFDALDCVLADDVVAATDVPPFDNSSLDGYAVRWHELTGADRDRPARFEVLGSVLAGQVADRPIGPGQAWKVMTGAPLPAGADVVVMVENSSATQQDSQAMAGDEIELYTQPRLGAGVRRAAGDVARGQLVFAAGTVLGAAHLGVLASIGVHRARVFPRLRVGVLVTGDELVTEDRPLRPGEIYESNRAMLMSLVRKLNCQPIDLGVAGDDLAALQSRLGRAVGECDVIITSGGVSMGDADPIKAVLDRLGRLNWLQLAIRPAKPFAYGVLDGPTMLLGLPGNPVSSLVSFTLVAAPVLRRMLGHVQVLPEEIRAIADVDFEPSHRDGRTAYLRADARFGADGRLHVRPVARQDSHQLSATANANALVRVPDGAQPMAGEDVDVILLS